MNLKDGHFIKSFKVPRFFDKISVSYDGGSEPKELEVFELALSLVAQLADRSSPIPHIIPPNVHFLETCSPTFTLDDDMFGCFYQAIIFPVAKWRKDGLSKAKMLIVMVEELCHAVWQIPDGPPIEEKVTEVFHQIYPDFSYWEFVGEIL